MTTTKTPDLKSLAEWLERLTAFEDGLWSGAPDVARAETRAARLTTAGQQLTDAAVHDGGDVQAVIAARLDTLLDGEVIDAAAFRADTAAAVAGAQVRSAVAAAIASRPASLRGDLDQARQANAAAALKHLDATVRELVDVGRVLLPLAEVRGTLADSGRAGQAHALIDAAVRVHDRIRQRQYLLTTSNRYIAAMMARRFGIVRDVASLGPWATQLAAPGDTSWTDAPDLAEYVDGGGEPLFRLVCRDDLEAWVPTEPELTAASADMAKRLERARYRALHPGQNVETFEESDFTLSIDGKKAEPTARIHVETFGSRRA